MKDVQSYYDDFSHTYDDARHSGYHAHIDDLEAGCVRRWLRGSKLLEVGCGTGLVLARVRRFAPVAIGLDLSRGMLRRAVERGQAVSQGSVLAIPHPDRSFDLVCSFKVLPHVQDLDRGLAEIARVLDDGGIALLEFYNPRSLRGIWKRIRWWNAAVGRASHDREVYTAYHTPEEARRRVAAHLDVRGACGIVLLTPHPAVHRIPLIGALVRGLERALCHTPLAGWAGFYVVVAQKGAAPSPRPGGANLARAAPTATGTAGWLGRGLATGLLLGVVTAPQRTVSLREFLTSSGERLGFTLLVMGWLLLGGALLGLAVAAVTALVRTVNAALHLAPRPAGALWGALAGGACAGWILFGLTLTVRFDWLIARGPWLAGAAAVAGALAGWWHAARGRPDSPRAPRGLAVALFAGMLGVSLMDATFAPHSSYGVHVILDSVVGGLGFALVSLYPAPRRRSLAALILLLAALIPWCDHLMRNDPALEVLMKTRTSTSGRIVDAVAALLDWDRDGSSPAALVGGWDPRPFDPSVPRPVLDPERPRVFVSGAQGPAADAPDRFAHEAAAHPGNRPHIVLVTIDACRADVLPPADRRDSPLGSLQPATPVLDSLAARAAVFEAAYTPSAGTGDTFGCLFAGEDLPGILLGVPRRRYLPDRLARAGYALRAMISDPDLGGTPWGWPRMQGVRLDQGVAMADSAAEFLAALPDGSPGFAWIHIMDLHANVLSPFSPRAYLRRSHLELYASGLAQVDRIVGELLDGLRRQGLAGRTLVVVSADHGEEFGGHGHYHHNIALYEPALRVPLWVSGPAVAPGARHGVVAMQDLYPTLLEAAGVAPGASAGLSLWAQLRDPVAKLAPRSFYSFLPQHGYSHRYAAGIRPELGQASIVDPIAGHKIILRIGAQTLEAYDLNTDVRERRNLAGERPAWLDPLLSQLWARVRGGAPPESKLLR